MPDWNWYLINPDPRHHQLDDLRSDRPILWALCVGRKSSLSIANALGMPLDIVRRELRWYKGEGLIHDEQAPAGGVWKIDDPDLLELRQWVLETKRQNKILDDGAESS